MSLPILLFSPINTYLFIVLAILLINLNLFTVLSPIKTNNLCDLPTPLFLSLFLSLLPSSLTLP